VNERIHYLPSEYVMAYVHPVRFHFSSQECSANQAFVQHLGAEAFQYATEILDFTPARQVHVCCYHDVATSCRALGREVSPTMAMAPLSDEACGLAIIHSPSLDPMNRDTSRMMRILVHEFVHLLVAERSGSIKILGDHNRNMRISGWLNEGIAEAVGLQAIGAETRISSMAERFQMAQTVYSFESLSQQLDDLDHAVRSEAFVYATGAVHLLCHRAGGIRNVFDQILQIEEFFDPNDRCCPSRLAEYDR